MSKETDDITRILKNREKGQDTEEQLLDLVYEQLHGIAEVRMNREKPGHTLQATALVHEAFLRLFGNDGQAWKSRGHFFRAAAEAMRRILIDHARKKKSAKRGGEEARAAINVLDLALNYDPNQILELDEAMTSLELEDSSAAEVVKLRFYGGLSVQETAQTMNISERSVARDWAFARAYLYALLGPKED